MAMLCPEPETDAILAWFGDTDRADGIHGAELVTCPWTRTELASALSIKQRTKQLKPKEVEMATSKGLMILAVTRVESVETIDFDEAAHLCAASASNLRAPDALHLALAKRVGCKSIATSDVVVQKAAIRMGLKVVKFSLDVD